MAWVIDGNGAGFAEHGAGILDPRACARLTIATENARACARAVVGPVPGAVVLRSDEVRKELSGVSAVTRLGPEGYSPAMTHSVYATLVARAAQVLERGHSGRVEGAAVAADVPFVGLWLDAPES